MLGFPILYCKGMRPMMFQLSGFCYTQARVHPRNHPRYWISKDVFGESLSQSDGCEDCCNTSMTEQTRTHEHQHHERFLCIRILPVDNL